MDAQLGKQGVNSAYLQAGATASVAQIGSFNVVLPLWIEKRQSCKPFDDILAGAWSDESLQEFLKNQASGDNRFAALKGLPQSNDFDNRRSSVTAKC
jgi:hypothetical protein